MYDKTTTFSASRKKYVISELINKHQNHEFELSMEISLSVYQRKHLVPHERRM